MIGTTKLFADIFTQANKVFLEIEKLTDNTDTPVGMYKDKQAILSAYKDTKSSAVKSKMMGILIDDSRKIVNTAYNILFEKNILKDIEKLEDLLVQGINSMEEAVRKENEELQKVEEIYSAVEERTGSNAFSTPVNETLQKYMKKLTESEELSKKADELIKSLGDDFETFNGVFDIHEKFLAEMRETRKKVPTYIVSKKIDDKLSELQKKRTERIEALTSK